MRKYGLWLAVALGFLAIEAQAGNDTGARFKVKGKGKAGFGSEQINLVSGIARFRVESKELEVGLFPFEVSDEDLKKALGSGMIFYATIGKPSPDPAKWKEAPYIVLGCQLDGDAETYDIARLKGCAVNVTNWKGAGTKAAMLDDTAMREILKEFSFAPASPQGLKFRIKENSDRPMTEGFRYEAELTAP